MPHAPASLTMGTMQISLGNGLAAVEKGLPDSWDSAVELVTCR
jgi:hypothetical protein